MLLANQKLYKMKQKTFVRPVVWVAFTTAVILCVPLVAMQFTDEVNWTVNDFIIMAVLIFSTGLGYVALSRLLPGIIHRAAIALAVASTFLLVWANLAVGLIGSGPNTANFMYIIVLAIVVVGSFFYRAAAKGMERVMFATALTLLLIAVVQLVAKMYNYSGSSVTEILLVNAFFAVLYSGAGLLFRYAATKNLR